MTRVAAIDCGTNSIRLLVAEIDGTGLTEVVRRMEIVRLGQGVDRTGEFLPEAIERTRQVLGRYAAEARALGAERVRMVATSATRDVANRAAFDDMVLETLGVEPEVISGDQEARLSFLGATRELRPRSDIPGPYLVVDIGGGSTEFVLGTSTVDAAISVDIGCVRLTERHLHSDPPTRDEVHAALADITAGIARASRFVAMSAARSVLGLAGSVTTVAALALGLPTYDPQRIHLARISARQVSEVTHALLTATRAERAALPVMHPGRVDVIGAGALVLDAVLQEAEKDAVVASEHDILDGIAWSLVAATVSDSA